MADWRSLLPQREEPPSPPCSIATEFQRRLEEIVFRPLGDSPTLAQVAQAKYLLQEQAQAWRKSLPSDHQGRSLDRHRCVLDAYDTAYERLHLMQLRIMPPDVIADYDELRRQAEAAQAQPKTRKPKQQGKILFATEE